MKYQKIFSFFLFKSKGQEPRARALIRLIFLTLLFFSFEPISVSYAIDLEKGKEIFTKNCIVCHIGGNNLIIPEKNLKKDALEENGMNKVSAISYQVLNGKNGMPAFGGRLSEKEIEEVASYVLEKSSQNFE